MKFYFKESGMQANRFLDASVDTPCMLEDVSKAPHNVGAKHRFGTQLDSVTGLRCVRAPC
jgi:hypothetical protein